MWHRGDQLASTFLRRCLLGNTLCMGMVGLWCIDNFLAVLAKGGDYLSERERKFALTVSHLVTPCATARDSPHNLR